MTSKGHIEKGMDWRSLIGHEAKSYISSRSGNLPAPAGEGSARGGVRYSELKVVSLLIL